MNIINNILFRFVFLAAPLYRRLGVDLHQLESIVGTKLVMDDRRPNIFQQMRTRQSDKPVQRATLVTMFVSVILGLSYLLAFYIGADTVSQLTLYFAMFLLMLATSLIADFTAVLIDVRDNYILLPKPVNDRTVVVARLLHIFIHICKLVIPMALPGFGYMVIHHNLYGGLVFLLMVLLATIFCVFLINAVYILILQITTPARFQSVISYIQIIFAVASYASYQLVPKIVGRFKGAVIDLSSNPLILLSPSYWFAGGWKVLTQFAGTGSEIAALVCVFVLPLASIWVVIRYLAPAFNQKLSLLSSSEQAVATGPAPVQHKATVPVYLQRLAGWLTGKGAERAGFFFTWKMTARSRDFKLRVYPAVGYVLVLIVMLFFSNKTTTLDDIRQQTISGRYVIITAIYFACLLLLVALNQLPFSDKYKASWIFYVTPVEKPGILLCGGVKAVILKFFIPLACIISLPLVWLAGLSIVPNLLLGLSNELLAASLIVYLGSKKLPFSQTQQMQDKTGAFIRTLFLFMLIFIIGALHYLVYAITPVVYVLAALSLTATWYILGSIKSIGWPALSQQYRE